MPTRQQMKLAKALREKAQANLAELRSDKATAIEHWRSR